MKLFKNYQTLSDYNTDKISVSKDNLTYVQNGVTYTADSPEGITSYNTICFINDKKIIKKNDIDYDGVDATRYLRRDEGSIIQIPGKKSFTYIAPNLTYSVSYGDTIPYIKDNISYVDERLTNGGLYGTYFNGSYVSKRMVINNHPANPHSSISIYTNDRDGHTSYSAQLYPNRLLFGYENSNSTYYNVFTKIQSDPSNVVAIQTQGTYNYGNLRFVQSFRNDRWPYKVIAINKSLAYTAYNTSVDPSDPSYTYTGYTTAYAQTIMTTGFGDGYKGKFYIYGWSNYNDLINGKRPDIGAALHSTQVGLTFTEPGVVKTKLGFVDSNPDDKDVKDFTGIYFNDDHITKKNRGILWSNHTNQELMTAYIGTAHIGNEESSNYSYVCPLSDDGTIPERYVQSLIDENNKLKERIEALEQQSSTEYVEREKDAANYTAVDLNNLYSDAKVGKVVVDVTNKIRYEKFKDDDWFYYYFGA